MGRQINVVALGTAAISLWAGQTAFADFTNHDGDDHHGDVVIDRVDPITGLTYAHIGDHDALIPPSGHDSEEAHWSWVGTSPFHCRSNKILDSDDL